MVWLMSDGLGLTTAERPAVQHRAGRLGGVSAEVSREAGLKSVGAEEATVASAGHLHQRGADNGMIGGFRVNPGNRRIGRAVDNQCRSIQIMQRIVRK